MSNVACKVSNGRDCGLGVAPTFPRKQSNRKKFQNKKHLPKRCFSVSILVIIIIKEKRFGLIV